MHVNASLFLAPEKYAGGGKKKKRERERIAIPFGIKARTAWTDNDPSSSPDLFPEPEDWLPPPTDIWRKRRSFLSKEWKKKECRRCRLSGQVCPECGGSPRCNLLSLLSPGGGR